MKFYHEKLYIPFINILKIKDNFDRPAGMIAVHLL